MSGECADCPKLSPHVHWNQDQGWKTACRKEGRRYSCKAQRHSRKSVLWTRMHQETVRTVITNTSVHWAVPAQICGRQALGAVRFVTLNYRGKAPLLIDEHWGIHSINTSHLLLVTVAPLRQERHSEHTNAAVCGGLQWDYWWGGGGGDWRWWKGEKCERKLKKFGYSRCWRAESGGCFGAKLCVRDERRRVRGSGQLRADCLWHWEEGD